MEYKDYMFKVDEQLGLLGIGKGTGNYNKTDRDLIANSIIMLELIETIKGVAPQNMTQTLVEEDSPSESSEVLETQKTKATKKK